MRMRPPISDCMHLIKTVWVFQNSWNCVWDRIDLNQKCGSLLLLQKQPHVNDADRSAVLCTFRETICLHWACSRLCTLIQAKYTACACKVCTSYPCCYRNEEHVRHVREEWEATVINHSAYLRLILGHHNKNTPIKIVRLIWDCCWF